MRGLIDTHPDGGYTRTAKGGRGFMTGVGLLGCGAIGRELARAIEAGEAGGARLVSVFDQAEGLAVSLAADMGGGIAAASLIEDFLAAPGLELVVECASPDAVRAYAETALSAGKDMLLMSSGALADPTLAERLSAIAVKQGSRLIVPSGALGGIDAIRAVRGRLDRVTLTTTKPPRGLAGAPGFAEWEGKPISEPTVVFDGPTIEAVNLFPANVNVAATLSLAGLGAQETRVRVVADPNSTLNVHEVEAAGSFGRLRFRMELRPHERNPKTSFLAIVSAIEALRAACTQGIRVGT